MNGHKKNQRNNHSNHPVGSWLSFGAAALLLGGCGSTAQQVQSAGHVAPTLRCPAGAQQARQVLAGGAVQWRCERSDPDHAGATIAHGPARIALERTCSDGQTHRLQIQRRYVHGLVQGEETVWLDDDVVGRTTWIDSHPEVSRYASGVVPARQGRCEGVALCGELVGTVRCDDHRGQRLSGRWQGPGAQRMRGGGWISGDFDGPVVSGRVVQRDPHGDVFVGQMRRGVREGQGRTRFAGGGWMVGRYRGGELDGRVTIAYPTGIRVTTRWHDGTLVQLLRKERTWQVDGQHHSEVLYSTAGEILGLDRAKRGQRARLAWIVDERQGRRDVRIFRVLAPRRMKPTALRAAIAAETGVDADRLQLAWADDGFAQATEALREQLQPEVARVAGEVGTPAIVYFHDRGLVAVQAPMR